MEMTNSRWVWLFVIIFISSILLFVLNDREQPPIMVQNGNQTNATTGIIEPKMDPTCEAGFNYVPEKNICFNENPMGHVIVTFSQKLALIFTIALITAYEFKDWRIHLSSRILSYRNKYQETLSPITKCPNTHEKKDIIWTREGFDAFPLASSSKNIYIAKKSLAAKIGTNLLLKGELQKVSQQYLYEWIGHDISFLREILENPVLLVNKRGKIENIDTNIIIYLTIPLKTNIETEGYNSIKGNFGFGADRFTMVIRTMYQMMKGLNGFGKSLNKENLGMVDNSRQLSQGIAVTADAVSKAANSDIQANRPQPRIQQDSREQERREQV